MLKAKKKKSHTQKSNRVVFVSFNPPLSSFLYYRCDSAITAVETDHLPIPPARPPARRVHRPRSSRTPIPDRFYSPLQFASETQVRALVPAMESPSHSTPSASNRSSDRRVRYSRESPFHSDPKGRRGPSTRVKPSLVSRFGQMCPFQFHSNFTPPREVKTIEHRAITPLLAPPACFRHERNNVNDRRASPASKSRVRALQTVRYMHDIVVSTTGSAFAIPLHSDARRRRWTHRANVYPAIPPVGTVDVLRRRAHVEKRRGGDDDEWR